MERLRALLAPEEAVWLFGTDFPAMPDLALTGRMVLLQMALPMEIAPPEPAAMLVKLGEDEAHEMVALTDLAFPGFFRPRTYRMGSYYGVRAPSGELIAMGGERMKLDGYSEISTVCTHPSFRGRGHAESIIWQVVRQHRRERTRSFLHVRKGNDRAVSLYGRMGFEICREVTITRVMRPPATELSAIAY
jgi:ribosomal protein S18 acetylase RimI-like enzyme